MNYNNLPKGTKVLLKQRKDCRDVAINKLNDYYGKIVTVDERENNSIKEMEQTMYFIKPEIEKVIILEKGGMI